ncbi:hypothetical protein BG004_002477 [Podila humilis]|nr:hypothetical protein BG004_002477 [Podila humilis]
MASAPVSPKETAQVPATGQPSLLDLDRETDNVSTESQEEHVEGPVESAETLADNSADLSNENTPQTQSTDALGTNNNNSIDLGNDDVFDDFGSPSNNAGNAGDDEEFGEFGASDGNHAFNNNDDDDDDGFGDFGEVQVAAGGDNDDFGDFNDFAEGDGFQDSGDFGDFEAENGMGDDDPFGSTAESAAIDPVPVAEEEPVEISPDFNAVNSRQVETHVLEKLSALYPISKDDGDHDNNSRDHSSASTLLNTDLDELDVSSVLSDQELWTSLCEQSFQGKNSKSASPAPQFQWKFSQLRKEYYASLGLAVVKEQQMSQPTSTISNTSSTTTTTTMVNGLSGSILNSASSNHPRISSPMIVSTETVVARKPLDLEATRAFCQFTKENLGGYSGDEMKDIIAQLTELTRQASDELTFWLDQREQLTMDSERYNEMIASLVGRAAKLKDAESKQGAKSKRLTRSSFNLK